MVSSWVRISGLDVVVRSDLMTGEEVVVMSWVGLAIEREPCSGIPWYLGFPGAGVPVPSEASAGRLNKCNGKAASDEATNFTI